MLELSQAQFYTSSIESSQIQQVENIEPATKQYPYLF